MRYLAELNPTIPGQIRNLTAKKVTFVPMEAINEFGGFDATRARPIEELIIGYSYFENGDIAYAKVTPCFENSKITILNNLEDGFGFGTTEITVLRPNDSVDRGFLFYILLEDSFKQDGKAAMTGAGGLKRVPESYTKNFRVWLPAYSDQRSITLYLDRETAEIDGFIADQEQLIALLAERRTATITHAVTKGLDRNVTMRDSGVDWIGDIPEHWKIKNVRGLVSDINQRNDNGQDATYLSLLANIGVILYSDKGDIGNKKPEDLTKCKKVAVGDLVINSMNYGIGSYGISSYEGVCSPVYIVLRNNEGSHRDFIARIFECRSFQKVAQSFGNGILEHRRAIGWDTIKNLRVPAPDPMEQLDISNFINKEISDIDAAINDAQDAIELSKERRAAVISAAVTGKIDVRGLGAPANMEEAISIGVA